MKRVRVNRNIYSDKTIKMAIEAYRNCAILTVSYKQDYAVIIFWKSRFDETQTIKEFENYMIGVENS